MQNLLKALALLLLLGATSCIKENLNECPQVNLVFRYDADGTENVIGKYIGEAILYAFDRNGKPVMERKLSGKELQCTKGIRLVLPPDSYRLVCWGNVSDRSRIILGDKLEQCLIGHAHLSDKGDEIQTFDPLYHASCDVEVASGKRKAVEVKFHSAHVRMEIYVRGFDKRYGSGEVPAIQVTGLNGQYDFEMRKIAPDNTVTCFPKSFWDETKQTYTFFTNVLRFEEESPVSISVHKSQNRSEVFRLRLDEVFRRFPNANPGSPLSPLKREEAVVTITIDFSGTEVDVSILPPSWEEEPVAPGI